MKYIYKDSTEFRIMTLIKEDVKKGLFYSKENPFKPDKKFFCKQVIDFPKQMQNKFDDDILSFHDYDLAKDHYIYKYIKSETKLGLTVPFTEEHLLKFIKTSSCNISQQ